MSDTTTASATKFAPIFPAENVSRALNHYRQLGFRTRIYDRSEDYGFAERDRVALHVTRRATSDYPPNAIAIAYLFVDDADALYREWRATGVGGSLEAPADMPWLVREGRHVDPDGNVIRFGHPIGR